MPRPGQTPAPAYERGEGADSLGYGAASRANEAEPFTPASEEEAFLVRGTDRADEPVTAGLPFGEGPAYVRTRADTEETFRERVARQLINAPSADDDVRRFAQRLLDGE